MYFQPLGHKGPSQNQTVQLLLAVAAVLILLVIGTFGYHLVEGWSWFDSLYMTVITVSTVGFEEVHPLSHNGQVFAIVLILLGVGAATLLFTSLTTFIIERQTNWLIRRTAMEWVISKMSNHTIVCGYGRLAKIAAKKLRENNIELVIVEKDESQVEKAKEDGFIAIEADATLEDVLETAGIDKANRLITLLPKDADNLYVVMNAKEGNHDVFVISRAESELGETRLKRAGADRIMWPYRVGGEKIADAVLKPNVTDFVELIASGQSMDLKIEEIKIPAGAKAIGSTVNDICSADLSNLLVAALIQQNGKMDINPEGQEMLQAGMTLVVVGEKESLERLETRVI